MSEQDVKKMSYTDETGKNYEIAYSTEVQRKVYEELRKSNRLKMLLLTCLVLCIAGLIIIWRTKVISNIMIALFCNMV